jgi:hypothetical protein
MAFATAADVAIRLGRALTTAEEAMVDQVIEEVTGLIVEAVGRDAAWAEDLDPVPATLRSLCIEKAIAVGSNPNQAASTSEQLGAYQHSKTFRKIDASSDLFLTAGEERRVRRAVYGETTSSPRTPSIADDIFPPLIDPVTGWIE